jgi:hypothetical protein
MSNYMSGGGGGVGRCSVVGSGTVLHALTLLVRFPMGSLDFRN